MESSGYQIQIHKLTPFHDVYLNEWYLYLLFVERNLHITLALLQWLQ